MRVKITPRKIHLEVPNISNLNEFWSPEVVISDVPLKIKVLKTEEEGEQCLGVFIFCKEQISQWNNYIVSGVIKLISDEFPIVKMIEPDVLDCIEYGYGLKSMIKWCDLMNTINGYVDEDDSIYLNIAIKILNSNDGNRTRLLSKKTFAQGGNCIHRLTVTNVDKLMAVQSSKFTLQNSLWRITVYKDHLTQLGVRLKSYDTTKNFSCNVEMKVKLITNSKEHQLEGHGKKKFKNYDVMFVKFFEGWNKLFQPESGYIVNNEMVIEVALTAGKVEYLVQKRKVQTIQLDKSAKFMKLTCKVCEETFQEQEMSFTTCGHLFCTPCIQNSSRLELVSRNKG